MFRPEPLDIIIIVIVALLLFGANRLPETARAIGQSLREFRGALTGKEENTPVQAAQVTAKSEPTVSTPVASTTKTIAKSEPAVSAPATPTSGNSGAETLPSSKS